MWAALSDSSGSDECGIRRVVDSDVECVVVVEVFHDGYYVRWSTKGFQGLCGVFP